jgi:hypothetical protein
VQVDHGLEALDVRRQPVLDEQRQALHRHGQSTTRRLPQRSMPTCTAPKLPPPEST